MLNIAGWQFSAMIDFTSDTICPCLLASKGSKFRASSKGAEWALRWAQYITLEQIFCYNTVNMLNVAGWQFFAMIDFECDTICPCLLASKCSKFRASSKGAEWALRWTQYITLEPIFSNVSSFLSCVWDAEAKTALQYSSLDLTKAIKANLSRSLGRKGDARVNALKIPWHFFIVLSMCSPNVKWRSRVTPNSLTEEAGLIAQLSKDTS